jgi:hypothetical protein
MKEKLPTETSQIKEKEQLSTAETSQIKEKLSKPFIASFSEWFAKQKELIFEKTNLSFDETNGIVTCLVCNVKINISMNLETQNWKISNVTRHVLVSITLISSLILTYKPSLYCFIFIYFRIYTTKPDSQGCGHHSKQFMERIVIPQPGSSGGTRIDENPRENREENTSHP